MLRRLTAITTTAFLISSAAGCANQTEWERFWDQFRDKGSQPEPGPALPTNSVALRDTIGQFVTLDGLRLTQVRGFGLVVGLGGTGGADAPEEVKKYLQKEIRRRQEIGAPGIPAGDLLSSRDTVAVEATGLIPAAAKDGDRFDVVIRALGSQAKSLVGGRLILCDLKLYAETPRGTLEGRTLATAMGPVFVPPFDRQGKSSSRIDLRTGMVLGGGAVLEPRDVRLILNEPRYSMAQQIMTRINSRYAGLDPIADATGPGVIKLIIPNEFHDRKSLFLARVMHTTVSDSQPFLKKRAEELSIEFESPNAQFDSIGLAWEAIGKTCLPIVREHADAELPDARFYAARTRLRLGDADALRAMAEFARRSGGPFQLQAIEALSHWTRSHAAARTLREVLDDPNPKTRIAAYRALRAFRDGTISSRVLDEDNLILDVVDSRGPFLIYVQRLEQPRIALFGSQMRCNPPVLFPGKRKDGRFQHTMITAQPNEDHLTIIYRGKGTKRDSPPLAAPLEVDALVRFLGDRFSLDDDKKPTGLAVPYSEIVDVLQTFTGNDTIPAGFITDEMAPDETDETPTLRRESEF